MAWACDHLTVATLSPVKMLLAKANTKEVGAKAARSMVPDTCKDLSLSHGGSVA